MRLSTLVVLLALVLAAACDNSNELKTEKTKNDSNLPPAHVDLPDPPPASAYQVQEKNPDGTLRVKGLLYNKDKYMGKKVEVKGVIVHMSTECDPRKAKKAGKECPEPNLYIRDKPDAELALRIVGYEQDFVKKAKLEEGQTRVFKGTYQKVAQGFVATEDGLILLDYVDDIPVIVPEDAPK